MHRFKNPRASALALVALALVFTGQASGQTGPLTATASKGNLLVLPVGISQYERPGGDLQWADQDALDHAAFWKAQQGRLFGHVYCHEPLLNRQATRANILRAMKEIEDRARAGDTVIAPWSGHGADPRRAGQWLFCAADGYISAQEVRTWVASLTQKGARVLLIIDACFAGALDINIDGAVVLAACRADETSLDGDPIALHGNGLFTLVLLEGLRGQADRNGDGVITLGEVTDYVAQRVPELYRRITNGGNQQPILFRTGNTPTTLPVAGVTGPVLSAPLPGGAA